ncbi:carbohydrate ABC transporter permease [Georgenia satyanarayanai]|uniref:carbohydrate ABC transporter permease n=1 Tax=Georgenia satyanarayanai TaxID=860221 RepID=UPI00203DB059|nr:sugar ABC transporter permease [Georgenia satyanarayanai]
MSAVPSAPARPRRGRRRSLPQVLLVPAVVLLLVGTGYPIVWQLITSFREFGMAQQFGQPAPFVGLANYVAIFQDSALWGVVLRSVAFAVITAFLTLVVGALVALLMRATWSWVRITLQVSLLLAWAMPVVAAMTVWIWLFDRRRGVVNWVLEGVGLTQFHRFDWLAEPMTFFMVASIVVIWMSVPFVALSVYAGLTQVSTEVIEASQLDGASGAQRFRYILLPMIRPVVAIVLLLQLVWDLRVFTQIRLLQDAGSAAGRFDLVGTAIHKLGTGSGDFGMAAALSVFVLLITVALSAHYVRMLLKEDAS